MKTSHLSINGINKGKLLAAALPIGLAFASPAAFAVDAAAGQGSAANLFLTVARPAYQQLRAVTFKREQASQGQPSQCVAVGSALATNPLSGDDRVYEFGLALDVDGNGNFTPAGGSLGRMDFDNKPGEETNIETVSSTFVFPITDSQPHTIRWVATKRDAAFPDLRVDASSLSVMCFDTRLQ